ncbi:unnamed protein product [Bursaphelenchus xylophilus]|uniref:(pine wood nematode) hypothetical protein n=1 Tax=Bursaphelenchus xylophilus TaxID=6326 RepID=A0A1I7SUT4_BURXY|nr:unnamed protein product [Bursaphelenchus xylophilus]CAG9125887.1 unnamed protein product [Bursaphelenchus xylophilus]
MKPDCVSYEYEVLPEAGGGLLEARTDENPRHRERSGQKTKTGGGGAPTTIRACMLLWSGARRAVGLGEEAARLCNCDPSTHDEAWDSAWILKREAGSVGGCVMRAQSALATTTPASAEVQARHQRRKQREASEAGTASDTHINRAQREGWLLVTRRSPPNPLSFCMHRSRVVIGMHTETPMNNKAVEGL